MESFLPSNIPEDFTVEPDCNNVSTLEFSMHTFEHLYAMVDRANLSMTKDPNLVMSLLGNKDLTQFGKQLSLELYRNSSSWVYYNLGSIYWQMKGDAYHAVECARRAVHYAPRQYRDLALQNLGNIFHLAHTPKEAAIILHAAVDHAPHKPSSHFLLGNVYGILGDINSHLALLLGVSSLAIRGSYEKSCPLDHWVFVGDLDTTYAKRKKHHTGILQILEAK